LTAVLPAASALLAVKALYGEMATIVTSGQRAVPERLRATGQPPLTGSRPQRFFKTVADATFGWPLLLGQLVPTRAVIHVYLPKGPARPNDVLLACAPRKVQEDVVVMAPDRVAEIAAGIGMASHRLCVPT
jgi:Domain of unknown function (DUF1731)